MQVKDDNCTARILQGLSDTEAQIQPISPVSFPMAAGLKQGRLYSFL
jgi:hypothetical protein